MSHHPDARAGPPRGDGLNPRPSTRFWEAAAPLIFQATHVPAEVEALVRLLGLSTGARILEHAGGLGRLGLELARRGFDVTLQAPLELDLGHARHVFALADQPASFVQQDPRRAGATGGYAAILGLQSVLGSHEDPADDLAVLQAAHAELAPGGALLLRLRPRHAAPPGEREQDYHAAAGLDLLEERVLPHGSDVQGLHWVLYRGDRRNELHVQIRLYEAFELLPLLHQAGFVRVACYVDLSGTPYYDGASRLVVLAFKEDA
jgi:D-alanine-D-alanine ligase